MLADRDGMFLEQCSWFPAEKNVNVPLEENVEILMVSCGCYSRPPLSQHQISPSVTLIDFAVSEENEMDGVGTGRKSVSSALTQHAWVCC